VLEATLKVLDTTKASLAAEQGTVQDLKNLNKGLEAAKQAQIAAVEARAKRRKTTWPPRPRNSMPTARG